MNRRERLDLTSVRLVVFLIVALTVFCALLSLKVQAQERGGQIQGTVQDEKGASLEGVRVTARNRENGVTRVAVTDASGEYRLVALSPASYDLRAERAGFSDSEIAGLVLTIGLEIRHDFTLTVGSVAANVTVSDAVPIVDLTNSEVAAVISRQQIEELPISSRNYLSLALLLPGTSQDAGRSFFETVNVGASMTFNSTLNIVDGVINNWAEDGEPRQNFSPDAVREFKVSQSQYPTEYGLATGGIVQVVTRSGTNAFRGHVFEYFGHRVLNAKGVFETTKPDYQRHQFGGSVGGPIAANRTHFFFSFERTDLTEFYTITTGRSDLYSSVEGTFARPGFTNLYFGRVDHQISPAQSLFIRYAQEDAVRTCQGCGGTAARSGWDQEVPRKAIVVGHTWIPSPSTLNEFRFQYANGTYRLSPPGTKFWKRPGEYPPERLEPLQRAFRFPSLAYGSAADLQGPESRIEFRDTVAVEHRAHDFRFGGEYSHMPYANDRAFLYAGLWIFGSDQPFDPNNPSSVAALTNPILFIAIRPPFNVKRPSDYWAVFVHDVWKPRRNLTLNFGLRYEQLRGLMNEELHVSSLPGGLPALYNQLGLHPERRGDYNNFGPRGGLVWNIDGDGVTSIRAGYGLYYNHIRLLGNSFELLNLQQFNIAISNPSYPDPFGGRDPLTFASTAPPSITVVANDYTQPYGQQFNLGVSRTFGRGTALHVDGIYARVRNDRKVVDLNAPDPTTGLRPMAAWGSIDENQSISKLNYKALLVRMEKRVLNRSTLMISYTLAKGEDDNPLERFVDTANPSADFGPSSADRRHALVVSGTFELPFNFSVGAVWTVRSQLPFSAISGLDLNKDGFVTDFVPGTTRNQGARNLDLGKVNAWRAGSGLAPVSESQIDSTAFSSVDVRLNKAFSIGGERKLNAFIQVFNLANRTNLLAQYTDGRITNALSDNFGRILTARDKLRAELGVRFIF